MGCHHWWNSSYACSISTSVGGNFLALASAGELLLCAKNSNANNLSIEIDLAATAIA